MRIGLRLRWLNELGQDFSLGDLLDFVEHATPDMAIYRVIHPEESEWNLANQLLAQLIDMQVMWRWVDGGKKGQKPKPIPRPGVTETHTKKYTVSTSSTMDEIDEWLAGRIAS